MKVVQVSDILKMTAIFAGLKVAWAIFDERTAYHLASGLLTVVLVGTTILFFSFRATKSN